MAHARALAKKIVAGDVAETFTLREIYRNHWSLLDDNRQAQLAAEELVALGWLRAEQQVTGGRPTVILAHQPGGPGYAILKTTGHSAKSTNSSLG